MYRVLIADDEKIEREGIKKENMRFRKHPMENRRLILYTVRK